MIQLYEFRVPERLAEKKKTGLKQILKRQWLERKKENERKERWKEGGRDGEKENIKIRKILNSLLPSKEQQLDLQLTHLKKQFKSEDNEMSS